MNDINQENSNTLDMDDSEYDDEEFYNTDSNKQNLRVPKHRSFKLNTNSNRLPLKEIFVEKIEGPSLFINNFDSYEIQIHQPDSESNQLQQNDNSNEKMEIFEKASSNEI